MSVLTIINNRMWIFEAVHNAYTVALVAFRRSCRLPPASTPKSGRSTESMDATPSPWSPFESSLSEQTPGGGFEGDIEETCVALYPGPANSLDHYRQVIAQEPELVPVSEFHSWSNTAAFPKIPTRSAFRVWRKMKQHPHLSLERERETDWRIRPVQGDLNSTNDRHRFLRDDGRGAFAQSQNFIRHTTGPDSSTTMGLPPGQGARLNQ